MDTFDDFRSPPGAVSTARDLLASILELANDENPGKEIPNEQIMSTFDRFTEMCPKLLDEIYSEGRSSGLIIPMLYGYLGELLQAAAKRSKVPYAEYNLFILVGKIAVAGSPERAAELMDQSGIGVMENGNGAKA